MFLFKYTPAPLPPEGRRLNTIIPIYIKNELKNVKKGRILLPEFEKVVTGVSSKN